MPYVIHTYAATDDTVPEGRRAIAVIQYGGADRKKWATTFTHGETPEAARVKIETWFKEQLGKVDGRRTKDPMVRLNKTLDKLETLIGDQP